LSTSVQPSGSTRRVSTIAVCMTISTETPPPRAVAAEKTRRAGRELVLEWIFEPLSSLLLPVLLRLRVPPPAVVLANAIAGLLAAVAIGRGELVTGALLLQVKTLLDNSDGRLARASGQVTLAGRYLDTIADLVVNAAIFAALAHVTGMPYLALAAFVALALVLSADFNVSELARMASGQSSEAPAVTGRRAERALGTVYRLFFAPQDRLLRAVSGRRFAKAVGGRATTQAERAYFDPLTLTVLANLGLTTQLAVLGVCLALGAPSLYLWLAVSSFLVLVPLQLRRERLVRREVGR
jgi:archaetidylinositol phosphate synthase